MIEQVECETVAAYIHSRRAAPRRRWLLAGALLSVAIVAPSVRAQTNATLQGTVTGPATAPLAGVRVSVVGESGEQAALTDASGVYRFADLPPGTYRLTATRDDLVAAGPREVELLPGAARTLDLTLSPLTFGEEVLVTSQKRTEPLQRVPMSITAVSSDTLDQQNVEGYLDLAPLVPGLTVASATPGQTRITLRGINTGGVASTVGVYVGDVPFGSSSGLANGAVVAADFDTFDIARIEVLRGPQGTLYGASSLGGVLKYVPNVPTTAGFEARVLESSETVRDGDLGYSLKAMANIPVSDRFALRASGFYRSADGYVDSIGNNPIPSLTTPGVDVVDGTLVQDDINSLDTFGGRFSALYAPSERFSLTLTAESQEIESDAPNTIDADPTTLEPLNGGLVQSRYHPQTVDTQYRVFSSTLDWDFGAASLVSVTSYATFDQDLQLDAAIASGLTGGPPLASLVTVLFGDDVARPLSAVLPQTTRTDKLTQELRLLSPENDVFEWLLGAYYTDEDSEIAQQILAVEAGTDTVAANVPTLADLSLPSSYEEYALFGHATWHVTRRLDLSFGARASRNEQVASQVSDGPLVGGHTQFDDARSSETPFTYSLSPRYELAPSSFVSARVATGFRPGGPNVLPPGVPEDTPLTYDSDRLTSYEAGWKTSGAGGKYSLDLSAYYLDWTDIQLFAVVNGFGINGNGGTAVSKGGELAASFVPTPALSFSLNGAYTDATLTKDTDPIVGGLDGDPLPYVPTWSLGLSGNYDWAVGDDWTLYVGTGIGYVGDRSFDFGTRKDDGSLRELDSYTTVDLRAGAYVGRWSVELYGRNVTDEMGVAAVDTGGGQPNGAYGLAIIRPRTIGLSIGVRMWGL